MLQIRLEEILSMNESYIPWQQTSWPAYLMMHMFCWLCILLTIVEGWNEMRWDEILLTVVDSWERLPILFLSSTQVTIYKGWTQKVRFNKHTMGAGWWFCKSTAPIGNRDNIILCVLWGIIISIIHPPCSLWNYQAPMKMTQWLLKI